MTSPATPLQRYEIRLTEIYGTPGVTVATMTATEGEWARYEDVAALLSETGDMVAVPRATLKRWKEDLGGYWFSSDGEDEYNNDEIIAIDREIVEILK